MAARPSLLPARAARRATVQPKALAGFTEVAQLAESEAGFIFGVSGVMVAITLIVSGEDAPRRRRRRAAAAPPCAASAWEGWQRCTGDVQQLKRISTAHPCC